PVPAALVEQGGDGSRQDDFTVEPGKRGILEGDGAAGLAAHGIRAGLQLGDGLLPLELDDESRHLSHRPPGESTAIGERAGERLPGRWDWGSAILYFRISTTPARRSNCT